MAGSFLFGSLETLINAAIKLDPIAEHKFQAFNGKSLAVQTSNPQIRATLYIHNTQFVMHNRIDGAADALITGPFSALIAQVASSAEFKIGGPIAVSGDLSFVQALHAIARDLDMDWEEPLSQIVGDPIAHQIGQFGRGLFSWGKDTAANLLDSLSSQAKTAESGIVSGGPLEAFNDGIDTLSLDLDRLEARVQRLHANTSKP